MEILFNILNSSVYVIEVIVALGVLVTVHEFGHFIIAKAAGMRVDEFAVGFGKAIISIRKGETLYSLRLLPLGGYNRIYGMEIDEEGAEEAELSEEDKRRAFNLQPAYKRAAVILAGSLMNFALAVLIIFCIRAFWGEDITQVYSANPNGPAWKAGIREGDVIYSIDDNELGGMNVADVLQDATSGKGGVKVVVERQGDKLPFTVNPESIRDVDRRFWDMGAVYYPNGDVAHVYKGSPAEQMGLQIGDYVDVTNGKINERYIEFDGKRYIALDVRRYNRAFTLALPKEAVDNNRIAGKINYSGLGFFYDSSWKVINVLEWNQYTLLRTQASLRGVKKNDKIDFIEILDAENNYIKHPIAEYRFGIDDPFAAAADGPISVTFQRDAGNVTKSFRGGTDKRLMGISLRPKLGNIAADIDPRGAAFKAGLRNGDEIIAVGNEPTEDGLGILTNFWFVYTATQGGGYNLLYDPLHLSDISYEKWIQPPAPAADDAPVTGEMAGTDDGSPLSTELGVPGYKPYFSHLDPYVTLKVQRGVESESIRLKLDTEKEDGDLLGYLGFSFVPEYRPVAFFEAWKLGFIETAYFISHITDSLKLIFSGGAQLKDLTGPVGIVTITYRFAESGLKALLTLLVLLTVNLAIINLFPLPALDGGRMVFLILEMVFRKPIVSVKVENLIHLAGILLLLVFLIYITFYDINRIFLS